MHINGTEHYIPAPPQGWLEATPLEHYSSLNDLSILEVMGLPIKWPQKHIFLQFSFNLHSPLTVDPKAYLIFHTRDEDKPSQGIQPCFSIGKITRWRLDVTPYKTMDEYLRGMKRWHRCTYEKAKEQFHSYGCSISFTEGDWSEHALEAYKLYFNVAQKHGDWLYDYKFFQTIAKRPDYRLLCAWHQGKMIAVFVLQDEPPTIHSIACGMDYNHSTASYAYSWLHYPLIERAIEEKIYKNVDVGLTADQSKKSIGFTPVPSYMDVYAKGAVMRNFLRAASRFVTATITANSQFKFGWKNPVA